MNWTAKFKKISIILAPIFVHKETFNQPDLYFFLKIVLNYDTGYFFGDYKQRGITSGNIINLNVLDTTQSGGYTLSNGGVIIPVSGVYLFQYRVNTTATNGDNVVALFTASTGIIPNSVYGETTIAATQIVGYGLAFINAGETVTLRNATTAVGGVNLSTTQPTPSLSQALPVSLIIQKISD